MRAAEIEASGERPARISVNYKFLCPFPRTNSHTAQLKTNDNLVSGRRENETAILSWGAFLAIGGWGSGANATLFDFTYSGSLVDFTIPTTDTYQILAFGAQGGSGVGCAVCLIPPIPVGAGGRGAEIGGNFLLTAGEVLQIAVGGAGGTPPNGGGGGGGGGSFVVGPHNTPLVIAGGGGGGGGGGANSGTNSGVPGQGGLTGPNGGAGGSGFGGGNGGGGGGGTGTGGNGGGGGGGFSGGGAGGAF